MLASLAGRIYHHAPQQNAFPLAASHTLMPFTDALRSRVKRRALLRCCVCHGVGIEIHHIVPQAEAGSDDEDNAAPLCPSCHELYGANPTKRRFVREARDIWYELCETRFRHDSARLDEIATSISATRADLEIGVGRILQRLDETGARDRTRLLRLMALLLNQEHNHYHSIVKNIADGIEAAVLNVSESSTFDEFVRRVSGREIRVLRPEDGFPPRVGPVQGEGRWEWVAYHFTYRGIVDEYGGWLRIAKQVDGTIFASQAAIETLRLHHASLLEELDGVRADGG